MLPASNFGGAILNKDFLVILELWNWTLMKNIKYYEICNKIGTTGSLGNSQAQGLKTSESAEFLDQSNQ